MKTLSAGSQASAAAGYWPLAWAIKITRLDSVVLGFTSATRDETISGQLYEAAPGFNLSSVTCTLGFDVDGGEIDFLTTDDMTRASFLAGRWRGAVLELNEYNWAAPGDGFIPWPKYRLGVAKPTQSGFTVELRDLRQTLLQDMTRAIGPLCPYRLGSTLCTVNVAPFTHAFTITSVQSSSQFTCSGLAQAADYFTNGEVYFAVGPYASLGRPLWVLGHATGGVITLAVPLYAGTAVIGQTGTIVAGCTKRKAEDCGIKFSNIVNFGGQEGVTPAQVVGVEA